MRESLKSDFFLLFSLLVARLAGRREERSVNNRSGCGFFALEEYVVNFGFGDAREDESLIARKCLEREDHCANKGKEGRGQKYADD